MAKNPHKTNALGMELSPSSFKTVVDKEKTEIVETVEKVDPIKTVDTPISAEKVEKIEETKPTEKKAQPAEILEAPADILANLETDKPVVKGFSFTLKEENVKKLKALAKKRGVSASKMLDHILSEVIK